MHAALDYSVEIEQECSLHHYRTEIPNIIFQMKLDTYEFKAYCVLKWTAGDRGACFKSATTLCEEIGCQKPKLIEIKQSLHEKGLIRITKRKHEKGNWMPDLITIVDMWGVNMKMMSEKHSSKKKDEADGVCGNRRLPGVVTYDYQGSNLRLPKQEHNEQEQKEQQQHIITPTVQPPPIPSRSTAAAVSFSSKQNQQQQQQSLARPKSEFSQPSSPPVSAIPMQHNLYIQTIPAAVSFLPEKTDFKPRIYPILKDVDISYLDKVEITERYPENVVKNAVEWALHPKNPPRKALAASIKYACTRGLSKQEFEDSPKQTSTYEKLRQYFRHGQMYNDAECFLTPDKLAFQRGMKHEQMDINKFFSWKKLEEICGNFGINFQKQMRLA